MSRAFVREQDDAKPEPPPELKLSPHPNLVTVRGLALIEANVERLTRALAQHPDEGRAALVQRDLRYWAQRRASAALRRVSALPADIAGFGSRVTITRDAGGPEAIEIVGEDEADPAAGRFSWVSPIGAALIGAEAGETVEIGPRRPPIRIRVLAVDNSEAS